jgi:xanthine phosphoribosyltransferase
MSRTTLTYKQIHDDTCALIEKIPPTQLDSCVGIIAVARGGCVPATIAAERLGIRNFRSVSIASYSDHEDQEEIKLLHIFGDEKKRSLPWLVIDELVDSGDTFRKLKELLPNSLFISLYAKPNGVSSTDYYLRAYEQNNWLVFPWEFD